MRIALPSRLSMAAFADRDPDAPISMLAGETMGTRWSVRFVPPRPSDLRGIHDAIVARLAGLVGEMSHWEPGSRLSRFNRAPAGRWVSLPPDFAHVITAGLRIAAQTGGAFDPAMGPLADLWGFGPRPPASPPTHAELEAAQAVSAWRRLDYDPAARRLRQPGGAALDLSGIAKGYAVDAVAALLAELRVRHCLVEIGGELVGRGVRPDGDPWWVDLEDPPGVALPPLRVALHGLAVATSGDYRRGCHTIDPRSGRPIANGVASVSVVHATALDADAWATALTVLGPDEGVALASRASIAARLVTIAAGSATETLTPALAAMLGD
jgi:thiamine biosynthesis lipoprotein